MNYLSLREIQLEELDIAKQIDAFCNKHNLVYFLSSGSLLGAVRHSGFIPWDDDMDLYMPRKDYDKFCELFHDETLILKYGENGSLHAPFAKVCNPMIHVKSDFLGDEDNALLWVDIFPLDGLPNNKWKRKVHFTIIRLLFQKLMMNRTDFKGGTSCKLKEYIRKCRYANAKKMSNEDIIVLSKRIIRRMKRCIYSEAAFVSNNLWQNVYPIELFSNRKKYLFEDYFFYSMTDADRYLKITYGDYMQLPPEDKRASHYLKAFYCQDEKK